MGDLEPEDYMVEGTFKPSYVLIAIDTHPSMFEKYETASGGESCPFKDAVNACYEIANSVLFSSHQRTWRIFAVALALEDDKASFLDFKTGVLDAIKFLKEKKQLTSEELEDAYLRKENLDLGAFLMLCKKKLKEVSSVFYKKTLIYITNDDNPVKDKNLRFSAINEAGYFEASDVKFELLTTNLEFDYSIFYNEFFSILKQPVIENIIVDQDGLLDKLSSIILLKYFRRQMKFFPFRGDKTRYLQILQKKFIHSEDIMKNSFVTQDGRPVKKVVNAEVDRSNQKLELRFTWGGVGFDPQEIFDLKANEFSIGYTLVHVSDRVTDIGFICKESFIIEVNNSEELKFFDTFWQYCVDNNKVLICIRKLTDLDKIRFVELIPKFANNVKAFMMKTIPFWNKIRAPQSNLFVKEEDEEDEDVSEDKIEMMDFLIERLTADYNPKMFLNPSLARKKAFLRSKLLDEPLEEVDVNLGQNDVGKHLGELAWNFNETFGLVVPEAATATKRKPASASGGSRSKKSK